MKSMDERLSKTAKEKTLERFEELIHLGEKVRKSIPTHPFEPENTSLLSEWRSRALNLFASVLPKGNPVLKLASNLSFVYHVEHDFEVLFGDLRGVHEDFKAGMFDRLQMRVESEVSVDLLEQSERLLSETDDRCHSYIPAAVLAGAVLEKNLRSLCERHEPSIRTTKPSGQPKAMNALVDDLKKADVLNDYWAKQLKAWVVIRNDAAHGRIEKVSPDQVNRMIEAIPDFLRTFMK